MQNARGEPFSGAGSHENVLKRKVGCDVTFEVGPAKEIISCHKIFLIARSSIFEVMFKDKWTNNEAPTEEDPIRLTEVDPRIFQSFLMFIYTDLIEPAHMSVTNVEKLLYLAEKYNVLKLKNQCEEMLTSIVELNNVIQIHSTAERYSLTKLIRTTRYMMTEKFCEMISDSSFLTMDARVLAEIVASDYTALDEIKLFHAVMKWSKFQCKKLKLKPSSENLRTVLGPILAHVRFPIMGTWKFRKYVVPRNILTNKEKLAILKYLRIARKGRSNLEASHSLLRFNVNRRKTGAKIKAKRPNNRFEYPKIQSTRGLGAEESYLNLLTRKVRCDVTFKVGPEKEIISCHKIFLIARSSVFEVMFEDRWTTNHRNKGDDEIIKLPDVEPAIFQSFLKFLYADLIEPADESVQTIKELLYLAEKYNVLELKIRCEDMFLSMLTLNNVIQIHALAEQYSLAPLHATAKQMITSEFWKLISEESFLTLDTSLLTRFVATDVNGLNLDAVLNWSESQCKKLKEHFNGREKKF